MWNVNLKFDVIFPFHTNNTYLDVYLKYVYNNAIFSNQLFKSLFRTKKNSYSNTTVVMPFFCTKWTSQYRLAPSDLGSLLPGSVSS